MQYRLIKDSKINFKIKQFNLSQITTITKISTQYNIIQCKCNQKGSLSFQTSYPGVYVLEKIPL